MRSANHRAEQKCRGWARSAIEPGVEIEGPAIVASEVTTFLVNPGWTYVAAKQGASWFLRNEAPVTRH